MRIAIWLGFGLLMLVWTALSWLAATVARWSADALKTGGVPDLSAVQSGLSGVPEPVKQLLGGDMPEAIVATVQWATQWMEPALPWLGSAVGFLVPLVWVGWGLVAILLVVAAVALHLLTQRLKRFPLPRFT